MASKKLLSEKQQGVLLEILAQRFQKNMHRHKGIQWDAVLNKLLADSSKIWSLNEMESSGGEPDVIGIDKTSGSYIFCDCAVESPIGRRSLCYDREALESRKENKPANNVIDMAFAMGIDILTEETYRLLQQVGVFDAKTSSWLQTPESIRKLGGAIFGDYRYGQIFIYHNGAQSYYAARGFRGLLRV